MTKDLAILISEKQKWLTTEDFMDRIAVNMEKKMK